MPEIATINSIYRYILYRLAERQLDHKAGENGTASVDKPEIIMLTSNNWTWTATPNMDL